MNPDVLGLLLGALCGAAVGVERQWSGRASGPGSHFAGIRTFTLLGGLGALAGWLSTQGLEAAAITMLAGGVAIVAISYAAVSRRDLDATTEVAALVVLTSGFLAGNGHGWLASGITVITAVLLVEKTRLHSWVNRISDTGLRAGFRFALMAVVILPLLPEGPYGPLDGVKPRELWMLVLLFSGISFVAYVIRSFLGPAQGYVWAGVLGGLISSTNVTLTFSRHSRTEPGSGTAMALGVIAACTMLYFRVLAALSVLNPALALAVVPYAVGPAVLGSAMVWWGLRKPADAASPESPSQPLQFRSAVQMAVLFQLALFAIGSVQRQWGSTGLLVSGAVLGFTDVDALVTSMARAGAAQDQLSVAAMAIAVGIVSNTTLKLGLAAIIGAGRFRTLATVGLVLLGAATLAAMFWPR